MTDRSTTTGTSDAMPTDGTTVCPDPLLVRDKVAARMLGISVRHLDTLSIKPVYLGRRKLYSVQALQEFVASLEKEQGR